MSLDGKLLYKAKTKYELKKTARKEELTRRTAEVYRRNPMVKRLDGQLRDIVSKAVQAAFTKGEDASEIIAGLEAENLELQEQRRREIMNAGFPANYLDDGYMCPKCRDTGYVGSEVCSCLMELYKKEQIEDLSALLGLGDQSFDTFNLDYYSLRPDPKTGVSPRAKMEMVSEICFRYAEKFGKNSPNLFLNGAPGLGKTFLSACIAKTVAENGFSVVYDSAYSLFSRFEEEKFLKAEDMEKARDFTNRYLNCDLLIIDDLGMEMTTSFTVSALYNLMNTRLLSGKKTVINSNLKPEELAKRYSPQIMSRLTGEYTVLTFYGEDIRLLKSRNGL